MNGLCQPGALYDIPPGKPLMTNSLGLQPQAFISGQSMKFEDVHSTGKIDMISVVFEPCATRLFLHIPANLFYGQSVSTEKQATTDSKIYQHTYGD